LNKGQWNQKKVPSKSKAQREKQALEQFEEALLHLNDPRRPQGIRYPLHSLIIISLMAMVCGAEDAEAIQTWGETNKQWLSSFLQLPDGPPTQDVILAVFAALNPREFSQVFICWMELLRTRLDEDAHPHVAIDGKTSRRSYDRSKGRPAIDTVSAWLSNEGLVLGQEKTEEKSNEIKAIPKLLRVLDIRNSTVTIDAMGCQTHIAETIIEGQPTNIVR
jgi:hypothetical protein